MSAPVRALHFPACPYTSVVAILRQRRDEEKLPTTPEPPRALPRHGNIRGRGYYH